MKKIIAVFIFYFLCGKCFSQAGEWVWIHGSSTTFLFGNYGVQGVPSPTNTPPSLYEPCEWTDLNRNFWLFGGMRTASTNLYADLWKYDPMVNEWTWMKGPGYPNAPGINGTQGVPSPLNYPASRGYAPLTWVDLNNNLWMYGGWGSGGGARGDLWKYDISTNEWTWMKGPVGFGGSGVYGTQGIPDSLNNPGGRDETAASWTSNSGDLWFFGGELNGNLFNDVWRYELATNNWTWMKGDNLWAQPGVYGSLGIETSLNTPPSLRAYSRWKDNNGTFWLFGGESDNTNTQINNTLWRFNIVTNNWTWMGGSNSGGGTASYDAKCISNPLNIPGSRYENRAAITDQYGNFWFFGGALNTSFTDVGNDLWMYCVATNQWIWQSGDSTANVLGSWGTLGVSSPFNKPSGRGGAVAWGDNNHHFYLFGGASTSFGIYNDLWKYTIDTTCGVCPAPNSIRENNFTNELLVFPNPANTSLTISYLSAERQTVELRIYNTLGQVQLSESFKTFGKSFQKEINVEKLSSGIYLLQLKTNDGNISRKVIINH